jgi:hypothetical protein
MRACLAFLGLLFALMCYQSFADAQDVTGDPPFDFLDGQAIIQAGTFIYETMSTKGTKLTPLAPYCSVDFNNPTDPDDGYEGWIRVTGFDCVEPTRQADLVGFVQKEVIIVPDEVDFVIRAADSRVHKNITANICPSYKCTSLFSFDDIDFNRSKECIITYAADLKIKGYDEGWRLITADFCLHKGESLNLRYLNVSELEKLP